MGEVKEKPPDDFFKCVKVPIKHILKNPDINAKKILNVTIKCIRSSYTVFNL